MSAKTYDTKCYDLASAFLSDVPDINTENNRDKLAAHVQQQIEDWIQYEEGPCTICGEARGKDGHNCMRIET